MATKIKLSGVGRLKKVFDDKRRKASSTAWEVGYGAEYAMYVHEMIGPVNWSAPGTQAKFLEQPARELKGVLGEIVNTAIAKGQTLDMGINLAALRLQRESQKICPIDTSNLRSSAFTRKAT